MPRIGLVELPPSYRRQTVTQADIRMRAPISSGKPPVSRKRTAPSSGWRQNRSCCPCPHPPGRIIWLDGHFCVACGAGAGALPSTTGADSPQSGAGVLVVDKRAADDAAQIANEGILPQTISVRIREPAQRSSRTAVKRPIYVLPNG